MTLSDLNDYLVARQCGVESQTIALVTACIDDGIMTGKEIVKAVSDLGISKQYVGFTLSKNCGRSSERYRWFKDTEGLYNLHE